MISESLISRSFSRSLARPVQKEALATILTTTTDAKLSSLEYQSRFFVIISGNSCIGSPLMCCRLG